MKLLYIKTDQDNLTKHWFTVNQTDVNGVKPPEFDFEVTDYPDDYVAKINKYTITLVNDIVTFTTRPDWGLYEAYLEGFEPQDEFDAPLTYEGWINEQN